MQNVVQSFSAPYLLCAFCYRHYKQQYNLYFKKINKSSLWRFDSLQPLGRCWFIVHLQKVQAAWFLSVSLLDAEKINGRSCFSFIDYVYGDIWWSCPILSSRSLFEGEYLNLSMMGGCKWFWGCRCNVVRHRERLCDPKSQICENLLSIQE